MSITNRFNIIHHAILKRNVIETLYSDPNRNVKTLFSLKASDDDYIICTNCMNKKYLNYKNYVTIAEDEGKFSKNAIYFPGKENQKIALPGNIFYNLDEFTITTWIKTVESSINPMTLVEVIPGMLFSLKNNDSYVSDNGMKSIINSFQTENNTNNNSINIGVYQEYAASELNIKHRSINNFNKFYWNYITLTFKNNIFYLFINGKLINTGSIEFDIIKQINEDVYTVIGSSFLDNNSEFNEVYIDDFVIYDKALFTSDFDIPVGFIHPNINKDGIKYDTYRNLRESQFYINSQNVCRSVEKTFEFKYDSEYSCKDMNKRKVFRFIV